MTIEERAELAVETFAAGKGNCTQSVLCAWEDKIPVDHDTLMKLGAGYGAGMGCMQATCGAVSGAVMLAGLKNSCGDLEAPVSKGKTYQISKQLVEAFQKKNGSLVCKELKGVETGCPLRSCNDCIADAAELVEQILFAEK